MKKTLLSLALMFGAGCSAQFIVRSPEEYRDATKAVLDAKADAIRSCYDGVLKSSPGASGTVQVHFVVARETGKITSPKAVAGKSTASAEVQQCVVDALDGLVLAPPDKLDGDATFTWDFQAPPPPPAASSAAPAPAGA